MHIEEIWYNYIYAFLIRGKKLLEKYNEILKKKQAIFSKKIKSYNKNTNFHDNKIPK